MKKNVILVLILLFTSSFSTLNVNAEQKEVTYVVVFDEAHLQFFTHETMNIALSSLNDSFDSSKTDVTIDLVMNTEAFTKSKLQGANLIIIPSPNLDDNKQSNAILGEDFALRNFINNGGSAFYTSNPFSTNSSYASHSRALTRIIQSEVGSEILLGSQGGNDDDNGTILIDDDYNDGNNSHVYFDENNFQFDIWNTEINNISRVLYYGTALNQVSPSAKYGNASKYTYAVNKEYDIINPSGDGHKWISGHEIGSNDGRVILIGSTIMFSDLSYDNSTSWVEVEDNLALFQNLVGWLLKITPLNVPQGTITNDFSYFLRRNIFFSILVPLLLLSLVFGVMIRSKSITFNRIFDIKIKRKKTKKVTKKSTKKTTKKATKKTTKKTRRKRN